MTNYISFAYALLYGWTSRSHSHSRTLAPGRCLFTFHFHANIGRFVRHVILYTSLFILCFAHSDPYVESVLVARDRMCALSFFWARRWLNFDWSTLVQSLSWLVHTKYANYILRFASIAAAETKTHSVIRDCYRRKRNSNSPCISNQMHIIDFG